MAFTAKDVMKLREKTGCGMMDCKKALTEADGDMDKAIDVLREQGLAKAAKKASRIAAEGVAFASTNEDGTKGVALEVNAETDFVAKNADFQAFVKTVADTIIETAPADVEELLTKTATGTSVTVAELLQEKIQTIGENIVIRRFKLYEGAVSAYIHAGGKISVLVKFDTDVADKDGFAEYAKDIAMQVAAANPSYLVKEDVPAEVLEHEKKIMTEQVINSGKPENIAEKIVLGMIGKYYKENCLVDQAFIKDNKVSVNQYTSQTAKTLGGKIAIAGFVRFEKGEGLEKRNDDFAAEVASMVK
ncbi:MAG: elongation factor Ts [Clostridia bacterium]|nr:elongation factor Ts [Clostridia bacterium]MBR2175563.1 elongation factor Ts [Clostridia bacterium]